MVHVDQRRPDRPPQLHPVARGLRAVGGGEKGRGEVRGEFLCVGVGGLDGVDGKDRG